MQTSNALDPQSPQARAIYDLAIPSTIIFALIFVIVTGAIIYAIFRFRARAGEPDPKQIPGNRKVEIAWTIIPFLIVILLLVMTISAMNRADPPPAPSPDLVMTGHQFWWQVDYPAQELSRLTKSTFRRASLCQCGWSQRMCCTNSGCRS